MTPAELMLMYLGWIAVLVTSVALGYFGAFDHLGRKRK